jgi:hypothetical protein
MNKPKVGDRLLYEPAQRYGPRKGPIPAIVTWVGNKYFKIHHEASANELPIQFLIETGYENSSYGNKGRVLTADEYNEEQRRKTFLTQLRELGWEPRSFHPTTSTETLGKMVDVLEAEL